MSRVTTREDLREAVQLLTEAASRRDDLIRELIAAGERPTDLARDTGLSRERIYQIKDRRR